MDKGLLDKKFIYWWYVLLILCWNEVIITGREPILTLVAFASSNFMTQKICVDIFRENFNLKRKKDE